MHAPTLIFGRSHRLVNPDTRLAAGRFARLAKAKSVLMDRTPPVRRQRRPVSICVGAGWVIAVTKVSDRTRCAERTVCPDVVEHFRRRGAVEGRKGKE